MIGRTIVWSKQFTSANGLVSRPHAYPLQLRALPISTKAAAAAAQRRGVDKARLHGAAFRGASLKKKRALKLCDPTTELAAKEFALSDPTSLLYLGTEAAANSALARFTAEVSKEDREINLIRAAACLALHANLNLDVEVDVLQELARLGEDFRAHVESGENRLGFSLALLPEEVRLHTLAESLCKFLRGKGFAGCARSEDEFYVAENTLLDQVLARKRGIPIALSLIYMEVGRAGGLELRGANVPGHFLLTFGHGEHAGFLDAFANSTVDETDVEAMLNRVFAGRILLDPNWRTSAGISNVVFLSRMVRSLMHVYGRNEKNAQSSRLVKYAHVVQAQRNASSLMF